VNVGCVVVGLAWVFFSPLASVVINEVLYDPDGADTGYEFVELFNSGTQPVVLDGWSLETGNGTYEDRWKLEWHGSASDIIQPQGFFLIGEESVVPTPNVVADLDLQNGPDACRLTSPEGDTDVVGWGNLIFPEYFEGEPTADAGSGSSIGRDPDGLDSDFNKTDFAVFAVPSPGDYNRPPTDLVMQSLGLSRYTPPRCRELDLVCRIHNAGSIPCGSGATLTACVRVFTDSVGVSDDLEPGETLRMVVKLPNPGEGIHEASAWLAYRDDRWKGNDTVRTSIVVPPPPLVVNEIMFEPGGRDCEWIELLNRSEAALSLEGWTLEDSRGKPEPFADGAPPLAAGAFLVLVEDEKTFGALHPEVPQEVYHRPSGGWPTLNDVDGPLGYADAVVVRDGFGTMVDSVAYGKNWSTPGNSVERIDPKGQSPNPANWSPHFGTSSGSPGAANSVSFHLPTAGMALTLSPQTFSPDGDGQDDVVAVSVALPGTGLVRLSVFDVNGRLMKRLIDGEMVESGRVTFWDGTRGDGSRATTGVYLVLLEAEMKGAGGSVRARSPLILIRR
jgi:hypothetical protein